MHAVLSLIRWLSRSARNLRQRFRNMVDTLLVQEQATKCRSHPSSDPYFLKVERVTSRMMKMSLQNIWFHALLSERVCAQSVRLVGQQGSAHRDTVCTWKWPCMIMWKNWRLMMMVFQFLRFMCRHRLVVTLGVSRRLTTWRRSEPLKWVSPMLRWLSVVKRVDWQCRRKFVLSWVVCCRRKETKRREYQIWQNFVFSLQTSSPHSYLTS